MTFFFIDQHHNFIFIYHIINCQRPPSLVNIGLYLCLIYFRETLQNKLYIITRNYKNIQVETEEVLIAIIEKGKKQGIVRIKAACMNGICREETAKLVTKIEFILIYIPNAHSNLIWIQAIQHYFTLFHLFINFGKHIPPSQIQFRKD